MTFDLLIKGGEVVDPGAGLAGKFDVAIHRDRIAAVDRNIAAESAYRVIDATGQYVTPGLIDLHTHVYHGVTFWGIHADPVAANTGVTTWLDVGSAGGYNIMGFREFIAQPAQARIYALLNISSIGLTAQTWELANLNYCDVDLCCNMIDHNRDLVLGIKVRMDRDTTGPNGLEPLRRAREAAERLSLPVMVHIANGPPEVSGVLDLLRPGDILTHCFTGGNMRIIGDSGQILDAAKQAVDRGVILDIGHGAGSFSFETAEALIGSGYRPYVISSDIHQMSILGPMYDLPTCLSKFLALGMTFADVIEAATAHPAQVLGMQNEIGTLKPGAYADIALFELVPGEFPFYDVAMNQRNGKSLIRNTLTLLGGHDMVRASYRPSAPWMPLSEQQELLRAMGHTPDEMAKMAKHS
ncbi:MAG: amidohydrolase/deacetylase family metallohydrolase [Caldilineaceae bacterium]|jgi:dihydroorotase